MVILGSFQYRDLGPWLDGGNGRKISGGTSIFDDPDFNLLQFDRSFTRAASILGAASTIDNLERSGREKTAVVVDTMTLLPLGVSAAIAGLGLLVGVQKTMPALFASLASCLGASSDRYTIFNQVILSGMSGWTPDTWRLVQHLVSKTSIE